LQPVAVLQEVVLTKDIHVLVIPILIAGDILITRNIPTKIIRFITIQIREICRRDKLKKYMAVNQQDHTLLDKEKNTEMIIIDIR
jgi:hypothetical protein